MFELVMSTFSEDKVLKDENNRRLWHMIENHDIDRLYNEYNVAGTERYLSGSKLLLRYMESNSGGVCKAKRQKFMKPGNLAMDSGARTFSAVKTYMVLRRIEDLLDVNYIQVA